MPEGTVTFEDISEVKYRGEVVKPLSKSPAKRQHEPLHGRVAFEGPKGLEEIVFGERDLHGEFSLRTGDIVEFNIAVGKFWEFHTICSLVQKCSCPSLYPNFLTIIYNIKFFIKEIFVIVVNE